jgi:hypothetical protein
MEYNYVFYEYFITIIDLYLLFVRDIYVILLDRIIDFIGYEFKFI